MDWVSWSPNLASSGPPGCYLRCCCSQPRWPSAAGIAVAAVTTGWASASSRTRAQKIFVRHFTNEFLEFYSMPGSGLPCPAGRPAGLPNPKVSVTLMYKVNIKLMLDLPPNAISRMRLAGQQKSSSAANHFYNTLGPKGSFLNEAAIKNIRAA